MALLVGFSACESEERIFDDLVGRTWVGDLGFNYDRYPVESFLRLNGDGFGTDEQYYFEENGGDFAVELPVRWRLEYNTLQLDYGRNYPLLEIHDVSISVPYLRGQLIVDGVNEGFIELRME